MTDDVAILTLEELAEVEASIGQMKQGLNKMTALIGSMECHKDGIEHGLAEMQIGLDRLDGTLSRMEHRLDLHDEPTT